MSTKPRLKRLEKRASPAAPKIILLDETAPDFKAQRAEAERIGPKTVILILDKDLKGKK